MKIIKSSFFVFMIILISGCSASKMVKIPGSKNENKYQELYISGKYREAAKLTEEENKDLLGALESGNMYRYSNDYKVSNKKFDFAEKYFKYEDTKDVGTKIVENVGAVLVNDNIMDYHGNIYEGIMVNTYKGINYMLMKDSAKARVEFNRVIDRQRRAKEYFEKEINENKKKIEEEKQAKYKKDKKLSKQKNETEKDKRTISVIEKQYTNLFKFKAYPDFVNPFSTYISGLFFYTQKDYRKATELFKQAYGMDRKNSVFKNDLLLSQNKSRSVNTKDKENYTWVIIEDGLAVKKEEKRFDIPLFIVTSKVYYTGIALPSLKENFCASENYSIKKGKEVQYADMVCDMDRVIKTEFKKRFPLIMTRAIISTTTKTILQHQIRKQTGVIGGILGSLAQAATTVADTRDWETLPKRFLVLRVKNSKENIDILNDQNKVLTSIKSMDRNRIVFLRQISKKSKVLANEITF